MNGVTRNRAAQPNPTQPSPDLIDCHCSGLSPTQLPTGILANHACDVEVCSRCELLLFLLLCYPSFKLKGSVSRAAKHLIILGGGHLNDRAEFLDVARVWRFINTRDRSAETHHREKSEKETLKLRDSAVVRQLVVGERWELDRKAREMRAMLRRWFDRSCSRHHIGSNDRFEQHI